MAVDFSAFNDVTDQMVEILAGVKAKFIAAGMTPDTAESLTIEWAKAYLFRASKGGEG